MRVVAVSDTHGRHARVEVPECDLLVHAGDLTRRGSRDETLEVLDWMTQQPAAHTVFVAGNHDLWAEAEPERLLAESRARGLHYLCDSGTTLLGLQIWGSPITPTFKRMAYNRDRGPQIQAHWAQIPANLDVLITHGPPRGVCDRMFLGMHVGCDDLLAQVQQRPPRLHLFGHIHEAHGEATLPNLPTRFVNAACRRLLLGTRSPTVLGLSERSP